MKKFIKGNLQIPEDKESIIKFLTDTNLSEVRVIYEESVDEKPKRGRPENFKKKDSTIESAIEMPIAYTNDLEKPDDSIFKV